jgi:hypothetical protein
VREFHAANRWLGGFSGQTDKKGGLAVLGWQQIASNRK